MHTWGYDIFFCTTKIGSAMDQQVQMLSSYFGRSRMVRCTTCSTNFRPFCPSCFVSISQASYVLKDNLITIKSYPLFRQVYMCNAHIIPSGSSKAIWMREMSNQNEDNYFLCLCPPLLREPNYKHRGNGGQRNSLDFQTSTPDQIMAGYCHIINPPHCASYPGLPSIPNQLLKCCNGD